MSKNRPSAPSLLSQTKKVLREFNLRVKKGLGQHFLVDDAVLQKIVETADLHPDDTVIEVGPGLGILTSELARRAGWVIAIELDNTLADILQKTLPYDNTVILNENVLGVDTQLLLEHRAPRFPTSLTGYKVVANLPYYITSPVLRHFLEAPVKPSAMVVMVQREVAGVITAGDGERTLLSVAVQFYGKPSIVTIVPAAAFYPPPDVDSAVVKIDVYPHSPYDVADPDGFFKLVKAGFTAARKQIANSLTQGLAIDKTDVKLMLAAAGIDGQRRAETLTIQEWADLWNIFLGMEA
jgi:16S rRNA (adenine1518-N6/adenine1519-N6)-dimethyltransferase